MLTVAVVAVVPVVIWRITHHHRSWIDNQYYPSAMEVLLICLFLASSSPTPYFSMPVQFSMAAPLPDTRNSINQNNEPMNETQSDWTVVPNDNFSNRRGYIGHPRPMNRRRRPSFPLRHEFDPRRRVFPRYPPHLEPYSHNYRMKYQHQQQFQNHQDQHSPYVEYPPYSPKYHQQRPTTPGLQHENPTLSSPHSVKHQSVDNEQQFRPTNTGFGQYVPHSSQHSPPMEQFHPSQSSFDHFAQHSQQLNGQFNPSASELPYSPQNHPNHHSHFSFGTGPENLNLHNHLPNRPIQHPSHQYIDSSQFSNYAGENSLQPQMQPYTQQDQDDGRFPYQRPETMDLIPGQQPHTSPYQDYQQRPPLPPEYDPEVTQELMELNKEFQHVRGDFRKPLFNLLLPLLMVGISIPALGYMYSHMIRRRAYPRSMRDQSNERLDEYKRILEKGVKCFQQYGGECYLTKRIVQSPGPQTKTE